MTTEIWKDIPGYEGLYQVSNIGRVYSIITSKILKQTKLSGYFRVCLTKNRKEKTERTHRLVMLSFIGGSILQVNHINGVKDDNRLENLEYCTPKENTQHAMKLGLSIRTGEHSPRTKLKERDVVEIRCLITEGLKLRKIAEKFEISISAVKHIKQKRVWKHLNWENNI